MVRKRLNDAWIEHCTDMDPLSQKNITSTKHTRSWKLGICSVQAVYLIALSSTNTHPDPADGQAALLTAAPSFKPVHWAGDLTGWVTSDKRNVLSGCPQQDYQPAAARELRGWEPAGRWNTRRGRIWKTRLRTPAVPSEWSCTKMSFDQQRFFYSSNHRMKKKKDSRTILFDSRDNLSSCLATKCNMWVQGLNLTRTWPCPS